jgi:hypothetical protein
LKNNFKSVQTCDTIQEKMCLSCLGCNDDDDDEDWCLTARQHYVGYVVPSLFKNNYTMQWENVHTWYRIYKH